MALKFSSWNSKMNTLARYMGYPLASVLAFDLPAGFTCPMADICLTYANRQTGKLKRVGPVLCYAAKIEGIFPSARKAHWNNFEALHGKDVLTMIDILTDALPKKAKIVRIHSSGDFFSVAYYQAFREVAERHPEIMFFGYSKILDYVLDVIADKPDNFYLNYSFGSKDDENYAKYDGYCPTCFIETYPCQYPDFKNVCSTHELGWQDYFAIINRESFKMTMH